MWVLWSSSVKTLLVTMGWHISEELKYCERAGCPPLDLDYSSLWKMRFVQGKEDCYPWWFLLPSDGCVSLQASTISSLSLALACNSFTNVCCCMGTLSPSLALMKEQKSLEAVVPQCPPSLKAVPALTPPGSSRAVKTTACHAAHCPLVIP